MSTATDNIIVTNVSERAIEAAKVLGLTLTSGYRSPEHNASVGGSPTSYHTSGQAYDFVGTYNQMDTFAAWAKASGMFKEVLWQTTGHYDHVHVAWGLEDVDMTQTFDKDKFTPKLFDFSRVARALLIISIMILATVFFMKAFKE